jgi:hypothetical protein
MSNTTNPPSALSAVPAEVQASQAWATLTDRQRDLLVVLAAAYTGKNNGALRVPWAIAQKIGFESPAALGVDRLELVKRGLIARAQRGHSGGYAITWRPVDTCEFGHLRRTLPSSAWRTWRPDAKGAAAAQEAAP